MSKQTVGSGGAVDGDVAVALGAAQKISTIRDAAKRAFIGRNDAIDTLAACVVAGEHAILLGPPGTAKSALVRFWADAMGLAFFRRVLNPDTTREDLIGPLDPSGLKETPARWDRAWAGLATSDFALLDEVGKASNQVLNMLLDAMEERRVTSGNTDREIPLHLAIGATNETLSEDVEAIWDRFTVRIVVGYLQNAGDFIRLLTDTNEPAPSVPITRAELATMRGVARHMAAHPTQSVLETMAKLYSRHKNVTEHRVSDRRWKKLLIVAAGRALLQGRTEIAAQDLIVGGHILWTHLDAIKAIQQYVRETVDEEGAEIAAFGALVAELVEQGSVASNLAERAKVSWRADKLLKEIAHKSGRPEWDDFRDALKAAKDGVLRDEA